MIFGVQVNMLGIFLVIFISALLNTHLVIGEHFLEMRKTPSSTLICRVTLFGAISSLFCLC